MINTRGFQVDVMPQYREANPALVAFNPAMLMKGALDTQQLADAIATIKAKRAQNEEIALTKQTRIEAENAKNKAAAAKAGADITLQPKRTDVESLRLGNEIEVLPLQGKFDLQATEEKLKSLPILANADRKKAEADAAKATSDINLAKDREQMARGEIADTLRKLDAAEKLHGDQLNLARMKLSEELANAKSDAELNRAYKKAQAMKLEADAKQAEAMAGYYDRGGSAAGKTMKPAEHINSLTLLQQRLIKGPYTLPSGDGQGSLAQYIAEMQYVENGVYTRGWNKPAVKDPNADAAIKALRASERALDYWITKAAGESIETGSMAATTPSIPAKGTRVRQNGKIYEFDGVSPTPKEVQ